MHNMVHSCAKPLMLFGGNPQQDGSILDVKEIRLSEKDMAKVLDGAKMGKILALLSNCILLSESFCGLNKGNE